MAVNLALLVCTVAILGGSFQLVRAARNVTESAGALAWAAKTQALSAQRLTAEAALLDGLIRDLAHGHGLHYPKDDD